MAKPTIQVCDDLESLSRSAAQRILTALTRKPDLLLCPASGFTPLRTYALLAEHARQRAETFQSMRVVKLDEWGGLAANDPGACEQQIKTLVMAPLGITADRYF